jgi:hypothetical protein
MPPQCSLPTTIFLAVSISFCNPAFGQEIRTLKSHEVVTPPSCTNNLGETVQFVETSQGRPGLATGMANRDGKGQPVVYRSNFSAALPEFQKFIDRHECAHHQTGDVDRPHPPRNSPEHLMNESISDCIATLRLRDEVGYDQVALDRVTAAMRDDMGNIGFPEISISSRISNIDNCFIRHGTAPDFIDGVLKQRNK